MRVRKLNCIICFCFVVAVVVVDEAVAVAVAVDADADVAAVVVVDENDDDADNVAVDDDDDDDAVVVIDLDDVALTLTYLLCGVQFLPSQKCCWDLCAKFCANLLRSCSKLRLIYRNKGTKLLFFQAAKFSSYPFLFLLSFRRRRGRRVRGGGGGRDEPAHSSQPGRH